MTTQKATTMTPEKEIPIANPDDAPEERDGALGPHYSTSLFRFSFGAYGSTQLYVWARRDCLDSAFEIAVEWLDDHAPGILMTIGPEDYREAATSMGLDYDHALGYANDGYDDTELARITEHAEADMTMIGHTTLKNGNAIPSWEWTCIEVCSGTPEHSKAVHRCQAWPTVDEILEVLSEIPGDIDVDEEHDPEQCGDPSRDVRLQVYPGPHGDWHIREGDSSYDQDHRGFWGASSVSSGDSDETLREIAADLLDQAQDSHAQEE